MPALRDNRVLVTVNNVYRFIMTLDVASRAERGEMRLHRSCRVIDTGTEPTECRVRSLGRSRALKTKDRFDSAVKRVRTCREE